MHNKWSTKYEDVIAVEGAPDSSPAGTPKFEVEIKDHLRLHLSCT